MSDDYLLFYSNKCLHSKDFLTILSKDVKLNQRFTKINIDNKSIKLPPYVKAVPSAIITVNKQPQLLVGTAIFKWYAETHKKAPEQQQQQNAILDWDPLAMTGYSDSFSYIDNNSNDPQKKSFAFLGGNDGSIYTPDEKSFGGNDDKKSGGAKTELDINFEKLMNNRNHEVPNAPTRL